MTTKAELTDFLAYMDDQIGTEKMNADGEINVARRQLFRNTQYALEHVRTEFRNRFLPLTYEERYGHKTA